LLLPLSSLLSGSITSGFLTSLSVVDATVNAGRILPFPESSLIFVTKMAVRHHRRQWTATLGDFFVLNIQYS